MEINELQNLWIGLDKKIETNTHINKEILKRMLLANPKRRLTGLKIKSVLKLILPFIILIPFLLLRVEFRNTINFYIGLILFTSMISISYYWEIRYYLLIQKIDFSVPVLSIKKDIATIEKYKIMTTRIKYLLMPLAIIGIFLMFIRTMNFNAETAILFILILLVFVASFFITFKYIIHNQFEKLNNELHEIEVLEMD